MIRANRHGDRLETLAHLPVALHHNLLLVTVRFEGLICNSSFVRIQLELYGKRLQLDVHASNELHVLVVVY